MKWFVGYPSLFCGRIASQSEDTFLDAFRRNKDIVPSVPFAGQDRYLNPPVEVIVWRGSDGFTFYRTSVSTIDLVNASKKVLELMLKRLGTFEIAPVHLRKTLVYDTNYRPNPQSVLDIVDKSLDTYLSLTVKNKCLNEQVYYDWKCVRKLPSDDQYYLYKAIFEFNTGRVFSLVETFCEWVTASGNEDLLSTLRKSGCWGRGVYWSEEKLKSVSNITAMDRIQGLITDWCLDNSADGLLLGWKLSKENGMSADDFITMLSECRLSSRFKKLEAAMSVLLW